MFSLVFQGVDGGIWIEHMLAGLPGGQLGFLIAVNIFIFFLAFFLDFFEIAFIIMPFLAPVAAKLGIDLVWFGVMICVNMQTSFMHPPFGFALFYLRGIADTLFKNKALPRKVESSDIYMGAIPWIVIQLILVAIVIFFPQTVTVFLDKEKVLDLDKASQTIQQMGGGRSRRRRPAWSRRRPCPRGRSAGRSAGSAPAAEDPMEAVKRALRTRQDQEVSATGALAPRSDGTRTEGLRRRRSPLGHRRAADARPRAAARRSELGALHEVVEARLGEAEPQVHITPERRVVVVDLLPVRVLGAESSLYSAIDSLNAASMRSFGKRNSLVPPATSCFSAAAFLRVVLGLHVVCGQTPRPLR